MFRHVQYGTDHLPGGSDGVETHTFRTKPALSRESMVKIDMVSQLIKFYSKNEHP